jgi:hypothetical protein
MPLQMIRWLMDYIIHQSNMPKQTSKNVSHDPKNPTRGGIVGEGLCGFYFEPM